MNNLVITRSAQTFIVLKYLSKSIEWLDITLPIYFPASSFELDLLLGHEDEDDENLDLRVYDQDSLLEFLDKMHIFMDQMRITNYNLYKYLSISHWRQK